MFLPHLDVESVFLKQHRTKYFLCSATQPVVAAWSEGWSCVWASAEESSRCTMRRRAEAAWLNLKGRPPALRGRASNGTPPPGLRWGQHHHSLHTSHFLNCPLSLSSRVSSVHQDVRRWREDEGCEMLPGQGAGPRLRPAHQTGVQTDLHPAGLPHWATR